MLEIKIRLIARMLAVCSAVIFCIVGSYCLMKRQSYDLREVTPEHLANSGMNRNAIARATVSTDAPHPRVDEATVDPTSTVVPSDESADAQDNGIIGQLELPVSENEFLHQVVATPDHRDLISVTRGIGRGPSRSVPSYSLLHRIDVESGEIEASGRCEGWIWDFDISGDTVYALIQPNVTEEVSDLSGEKPSGIIETDNRVYRFRRDDLTALPPVPLDDPRRRPRSMMIHSDSLMVLSPGSSESRHSVAHIELKLPLLLDVPALTVSKYQPLDRPNVQAELIASLFCCDAAYRWLLHQQNSHHHRHSKTSAVATDIRKKLRLLRNTVIALQPFNREKILVDRTFFGDE